MASKRLMRRKSISALRGACLVVTLATAALWVRSHHVTDQYSWPVSPDRGPGLVHSRAVFTAPGRILFNERCAFV